MQGRERWDDLDMQCSCPDWAVPCKHLAAATPDILLTTYGVLRSDASKLKKLPWLAVIIDEAQNIKNADTAQSKAVRAIPAKLRIAMSGTPVENRLSEFWSIMDFANQGCLGSAKAFKDEFATPIQREGDSHVADRFRRITAPFLLRRLKSDKTIINDLPPLPESRRHRPQPHRRQPRHPLRPLVEPRCRGPGHRPCLPHRPAPERPRPPLHHSEHLRGAHRQDDSGQAPPRRHDRSHRRELDWQAEQQRTQGDIQITVFKNNLKSLVTLKVILARNLV